MMARMLANLLEEQLFRESAGFDLIRDNIRSVDNSSLFVSFYFYNEKEKRKW